MPATSRTGMLHAAHLSNPARRARLDLRPPGPHRWLIGAILLTGTGLRLLQYFRNGSLWYDEALLALNILHRSWNNLLKPLDYNQGAPIGFLFLEKLSTSVLGSSEFALRAVPLIAGIGAVLLFWRLGPLFLSSTAQPIALTLFALAPSLISFSSQVKQYSSDVTVNLLLLLLFGTGVPPSSGRQLMKAGIAGVIAIWFSHPASFVLAGAAITWMVFVIARREWKALRNLVLLFFAWAMSFVLCYRISLHSLSHNNILLSFWSDHFPPFSLWSVRNLPWLTDQWFLIFRDSAGLAVVLGVAVFSAGCGAMFLRNGTRLGLLIAPAAIAVLASAFHTYPLAGRLMLFFVPNLLFLVAEGTVWIAEKARHFRGVALIFLIISLFARPAVVSIKALVSPQHPDDIKPCIAYIRSREKAGDNWYVYHFARYQFRYYAELLSLPVENVRIGVDCGTDSRCYTDDIDQVRGQPRVWVLFSHIWLGDGIDEEQLLLRHLDKVGRRLESFRSTGARAYLYDLSLAAPRDRASRMTIDHSYLQQSSFF